MMRSRFVEAKVEETIYGLFDWNEAVFRFDTEGPPDPNVVEVDLEIHEVLDRGRQRQVELKQSQEILDDPGIVLRHTSGSDSPSFSGNRMATRVFGLIDGERTVADILLHSHAPEFLVGKFLTALLKSGVVEIADVRELPESLEPIETFNELPLVSEESVPVEVIDHPPILVEQVAPPDVEPHAIDCPAWSFGADGPQAAAPSESEPQPQHQEAMPPLEPTAGSEPQEGPAVQSDINVALQLMASGEAEAALDLLNAMLEAFPSDSALKHLVDNAENEFRASMLADDLALTRVPVAVQTAEQPLTPEESFLQGLIDGQNDIRAILWVVPLREVDALRTLRGMLRKGLIEMRDPAVA